MPRCFAVLLAFVGATGFSPGAVTAIDVQDRSQVMDGKAFGPAGAYERVKGTVRFAIDPKVSANRPIADVELAPRNADGLVEFSADFYMLRPLDLKKGNGTILFEVVNRGNKGMLATFNRGRSAADPTTAEDFGDGLLLKSGYTLAWLGWQHDVPSAAGKMRIHVPVARGITGLVRSEFTPEIPTDLLPLGDSGHIPYRPLDGGKITVSARDDIYGTRQEIPRSAWTVTGHESIRLASPAQPGRLYEIIYESADPAIAGLGLAGIRDVISYLKRDHKYAIGFGVSQSAMVLRALLYEGFNQAEDGSKVFDAIFAHVAGSRRSTFQRFTQPSRTAGPLRNASLSPTEQFPYSDFTQVDPFSGRKDGVLMKAEAGNVVPKIFYTNSAYEYWGSAASLVHTTPDGKRDVDLPATTRMYMFSGGQHGPAAFPPKKGNGRNLPNFNDYRWSLRALLGSLQGWMEGKADPPLSVYPTLRAGTLTDLSGYRFPAILGVPTPKIIHIPHELGFDREPPRILGSFHTLVPQSDPDGNDLGGVRMPAVACPLGTFTGWNLRSTAIGGSGYLLGNTGSYIPFLRNEANRKEVSDPRRSVEERFPTFAGYMSCVAGKAEELARRGFVLQSDIEALVKAAARQWEWQMGPAQPLTSSAGR